MRPETKQMLLGFGIAAGLGVGVWLWTRSTSQLQSTQVKPPPPPPPRPPGLTFATRNLDALNAVVKAIVTDPTYEPPIPPERALAITQLADALSLYGLFDQEMQLRTKIDTSLRRQLVSQTAALSWRAAIARV